MAADLGSVCTGYTGTAAECVQTIALVRTARASLPPNQAGSCAFPFVHAGVTYYDCAMGNLPTGAKATKSWCLVGAQDKGPQWGYCDDRRACTKDETSDCTVDRRGLDSNGRFIKILQTKACATVACAAGKFRSIGRRAVAVVDKGTAGCTPSKKCTVCQGDCDSDNDCATGLKCFQRTTSSQKVPGCAATGYVKTTDGDHDYCHTPPGECRVANVALHGSGLSRCAFSCIALVWLA